nr:hypothetical protein [Tanacetum cinerariifolium]
SFRSLVAEYGTCYAQFVALYIYVTIVTLGEVRAGLKAGYVADMDAKE